MRIKSISKHLRPYLMLARRRTTINHAFAAAVAPSDTFEEAIVAEAMTMLGMNPDDDLICAYCHGAAETWDHIFATVKDSRFSGHGHRLGNLLPCCKLCNSRKGNKPWQTHLSSLSMADDERKAREEAITNYIARYGVADTVASTSADHYRLDAIRLQVLELLVEGDRIAAKIRQRTNAVPDPSRSPA
jgi:hypothetical protein